MPTRAQIPAFRVVEKATLAMDRKTQRAGNPAKLYMKVTLTLRHWILIGLFSTMTPTLAYAITHLPSAPEPGNLALLGLGLISLGVVRQRTRRREANARQEAALDYS